MTDGFEMIWETTLKGNNDQRTYLLHHCRDSTLEIERPVVELRKSPLKRKRNRHQPLESSLMNRWFRTQEKTTTWVKTWNRSAKPRLSSFAVSWETQLHKVDQPVCQDDDWGGVEVRRQKRPALHCPAPSSRCSSVLQRRGSWTTKWQK